MTDTATKETADIQPSEQGQPAPGLTLQDLILVAQIIQLTSQRGAYRAEELANVGILYNKLIAFLQSTGAIVPAEEPQSEEK